MGSASEKCASFLSHNICEMKNRREMKLLNSTITFEEFEFFQVVYFRAENKLKQLEKERCLLLERIHKTKHM